MERFVQMRKKQFFCSIKNRAFYCLEVGLGRKLTGISL